MLSSAMHEGLLKQVNLELSSAYQYAAMASHFQHINLLGFSHWMQLQCNEELVHAQKIVGYILNRKSNVRFMGIEAPRDTWETPLAAFEEAMAAEAAVSAAINSLSTLAVKENDHATHAFLEWFVTEQVEEEALVDTTIQQLKLVQGAPGGLFLLDRELGARTAAPTASN